MLVLCTLPVCACLCRSYSSVAAELCGVEVVLMLALTAAAARRGSCGGGVFPTAAAVAARRALSMSTGSAAAAAGAAGGPTTATPPANTVRGATADLCDVFITASVDEVTDSKVKIMEPIFQ